MEKLNGPAYYYWVYQWVAGHGQPPDGSTDDFDYSRNNRPGGGQTDISIDPPTATDWAAGILDLSSERAWEFEVDNDP